MFFLQIRDDTKISFTPYPQHIFARPFRTFGICSGEAFLFDKSLNPPRKITRLGVSSTKLRIV